MSDPHVGSGLLRLRLAVRRYRARTQGHLATLRFLVLAYLGKVKEVWIGDSNAVHMNTPDMVTAMRRLPNGRWVIHLGPRVMFSVANEGLPPAVLRLLRLTRFTPHAADIVWGFSFGEIDVRCHLVPRISDPKALAFVPTYLNLIQRAATSAGARRVLILMPTPQSATYEEQAGFPIVGTIEERVRANRVLLDAMFEAEATLPTDGATVQLVDLTDALSDPRGQMREDLTFDGLHTNAAGRAVFRNAVDALLTSPTDG